ncbi:divergent PAP2 family protein [Patescibacteria group bacterium]
MELPYLVIIPAAIGLISQFLKLIIKWTTSYNNDVHNFFSYSGAPSTHASAISALSTVAALEAGIDSVEFAICFIFGVLILRDALGVRNYIGKNVKDINNLVKSLPKEKQEEFQKLDVRVGHSRMEVSSGIVVGIILAWLLYFLFTGQVL